MKRTFKIGITIIFIGALLQSCGRPSLLTINRPRNCQAMRGDLVLTPLKDGRVAEEDGRENSQISDWPLASYESDIRHDFEDRISSSNLFTKVGSGNDTIQPGSYSLRTTVLDFGQSRTPTLTTFLPAIIYAPLGIVAATALSVSPAVALIPALVALITSLVEGYQYNHTYSVRAYFELHDPKGSRIWGDTLRYSYSDVYTESSMGSSTTSGYSYNVQGIAVEQLNRCWGHVADDCVQRIDKVVNQ